MGLFGLSEEKEKMKKRKCPSCQSSKTAESKDYFSCLKCGWVHKKTEREKENES